jgi:hypothetical protein
LFVFMSYFFLPLWYLSLFELWLMITPMILHIFLQINQAYLLSLYWYTDVH